MAAALEALLVVTSNPESAVDAGTPQTEGDAGTEISDGGGSTLTDSGVSPDAGSEPEPEPGVPLEPDVLQPFHIEPDEPTCGCHATATLARRNLPRGMLFFGAFFGVLLRRRSPDRDKKTGNSRRREGRKHCILSIKNMMIRHHPAILVRESSLNSERI
ncbi:MAG: hypothetical protein GY822_30520 [Deltaproteobacteria bacterium]|nr:hypothetical protein [Deltaproteobacteria bacterium]